MFDTSFQTMAESSYPTAIPNIFPTAIPNLPTQTPSPGLHCWEPHHHHNHKHGKHILVLHIVIGILSCITFMLTALSVFLIVQMRRRAATMKVTAEDFEHIGLPRTMTLEQAQREEMQAKADGLQYGTVMNGEGMVLGPIAEGKE